MKELEEATKERDAAKGTTCEIGAERKVVEKTNRLHIKNKGCGDMEDFIGGG